MGSAEHGRHSLLTRFLVSTPVLRASCALVDGWAGVVFGSSAPRSFREAMNREV
jgi:hypothetical protein